MKEDIYSLPLGLNVSPLPWCSNLKTTLTYRATFMLHQEPLKANKVHGDFCHCIICIKTTWCAKMSFLCYLKVAFRALNVCESDVSEVARGESYNSVVSWAENLIKKTQTESKQGEKFLTQPLSQIQTASKFGLLWKNKC